MFLLQTGTLTEDGLDMWGVLPKSGFSEGSGAGVCHDVKTRRRDDKLLVAMAACHSLTIIDGTISGDPLDFKMFEATGWVGCYSSFSYERARLKPCFHRSVNGCVLRDAHLDTLCSVSNFFTHHAMCSYLPIYGNTD